MNNSNVDGGAAVSGGNDDGARSPRLPHMRYTGLFSEKKQIEHPTVGGEARCAARLFTSFGRPWFQVESSSQSANPRPSAEDSRFSSSRDLAASSHRVVGKHSLAGDPKYNTLRDSQIGGHCRGNVDAVGSGAPHAIGFLPPPPEFSDTPSWATVPRSMSRMLLESKSISSEPTTTVLDRPKMTANLSPAKTVIEKAKDSGSDDGVSDDDDDDDDVNNDVPPPPLPTSSPPKIPFSFLHTESENDAAGADEQKQKASLALSVQSLFGVESDSSESREEEDTRNELFSSNDEVNKFPGNSIPRTGESTRVEKKYGSAATNEYSSDAKDVALSNTGWSETVKFNDGGCPPALSSICANNSFLNSSSENLSATASKSSAARRCNATAHDQKIERTSRLESVESCRLKNTEDVARDSQQRNEISFRNAHGAYKPTTTTTTADFTEPLRHTSAENAFYISNVRPNPNNDKDYEIDRVIDQRGYTVDYAGNQSKERRDRSKGYVTLENNNISSFYSAFN